MTALLGSAPQAGSLDIGREHLDDAMVDLFSNSSWTAADKNVIFAIARIFGEDTAWPAVQRAKVVERGDIARRAAVNPKTVSVTLSLLAERGMLRRAMERVPATGSHQRPRQLILDLRGTPRQFVERCGRYRLEILGQRPARNTANASVGLGSRLPNDSINLTGSNEDLNIDTQENENEKNGALERKTGARQTRKALSKPSQLTADMSPYDALLILAGDYPAHLEMQPTKKAKYMHRKGPLKFKDVDEHLAGSKCVGAAIAWRDGTTHAFVLDTDTAQGTRSLKEAAKKLAKSGARPFIETSPSIEHTGGAHLILVFDGPVNPADVRATIIGVLPALKKAEEYWPRGSEKHRPKVRLPGGFYQRHGVAGWCLLQEWNEQGSVAVPVSGESAIKALLGGLTSSSWVTEHVPVKKDRSATPEATKTHLDWSVVNPDEITQVPVARQDKKFLKKYGSSMTSMLVNVLPPQVAAYFNDHHAVTDILSPDERGFGLAAWRNEAEPSVFLYVETNSWCDFGGSKPGGKRDGGDALELSCRVHGVTRSKILIDTLPAMEAAAQADWRKAASQGHGLPRWVAEIMAEKAWNEFFRIRNESRDTTLAQ